MSSCLDPHSNRIHNRTVPPFAQHLGISDPMGSLSGCRSLISRELKKQLPEILQRMGSKRELTPVTAEIDVNMIRKGGAEVSRAAGRPGVTTDDPGYGGVRLPLEGFFGGFWGGDPPQGVLVNQHLVKVMACWW